MGPKAVYLRCVNGLKSAFTFSSPKGMKRDGRSADCVRGCIPHHAPLRLLDPAADVSAALEAASKSRQKSLTASPWIQWIATVDSPSDFEFKLYSQPSHVPDVEGIDTSSWDRVSVPSVWQIAYAKEDPPIYTNIMFPWKRPRALSTHVPRIKNPTGVYSTSFDLPQQWIDALNDETRGHLFDASWRWIWCRDFRQRRPRGVRRGFHDRDRDRGICLQSQTGE